MSWNNEDKINIEHHMGFIYEIVNNDTNERYIGKKNIYTRRLAKSKKDIAAIRGNAKYITKESNWRTYQSSSTEVKAWKNVTKTILYACLSKQELTYIETAILFKREVLNPLNKYVNKNIGGRYFVHYNAS